MAIFKDINYLAVLICALIYFFIGFIWYSVLFGKLWAKEMGVAIPDKPQIFPLVGQFLSTFLYTLGIAVMIKMYGTPGICNGILIGLLVTIFFVIPINSGNLVFAGRTKLFFIDVCERAVGSIVTGIILSIWI